MNILRWFGSKSNTNSMSVKLKANTDCSLMKIPLKFVYISASKVVSIRNDELIISQDRIKFHYYPDSATLKCRKFEIYNNCITTVQYSETNSLLSVTLNPDVYIKHFAVTEDQDSLFVNSIWFCLNVADLNSYLSIIEKLRNNCAPKLPLATMLPIIYNRFKEKVFKTEPVTEYVSESEACKGSPKIVRTVVQPIDDIQLVNTLTNISLSKSEKKPDKKSLKRRLELLSSTKERSCKRLRSNKKLLYAPSVSSSIEILYSDLDCLTPRQYLNDNIINFYLTFIYHELLTESQRQCTYFFNVFFNTRLIGSAEQQRVDTPATRHARVAKWTKKVDIFDKDFIVIPVIENEHWFLVIVCFPWMAGIINYAEIFHSVNKTVTEIPVNRTEFATKIRHKKSEDILTTQRVQPMPCILIFDSLDRKNRSVKVNIIREYLKSEWDSRRLATDGPLIFDKTTCRGYSPHVMKQDNGTDCGLYLLQYVESFFKTPVKQFTKEYFTAGLSKWFSRNIINEKRNFIKETILKHAKEIIPEDNDDDDSLNIL